ncbi:PglZ domain-containing protein [Myroides odoratimimus]|uniref:PglZ domain-containing protein n=1 Tax=Myroides odoratimimus TaxID=76832 RepID=UPI002578DDAF|nr:PglZ domain-containing protein [Myroides odoratimimus]MDM1526683.1 PglZ domain-containing protein [Myroides odoratimimus]
MVDQWIQQELQHKLSRRNLVVVVDPDGQLEQLLPMWEQQVSQLITVDATLKEEWQRVKEELFIRVAIEQAPKEPTIVYSQRLKTQLSFLFDYTETHGLLDYTNAEQWLRQKLFAETGLQIQLSKEELLTAAKASIGKDIKWWKSVVQGLADVVNLEHEILPLIANPEACEQQQAEEVILYVRQKLFAFVAQPISDKPLKVLVQEVVEQMLQNIVHSKTKEDKVWYTNWLDSNQYIPVLKQYVKHFTLPLGINHWEVESNHCFEEIDRRQLVDVVANLHNVAFKTKYHSTIKKRIGNLRNPLVPTWWKDISIVLSFDPSKISKLFSLKEVVVYYTTEYQALDRAIRNLYQDFLNEDSILKPIQEYYQSINQELIDKWFTYKDDYQSNQQGYLVDLIKNSTKKLAVIVGDGVRWEIAEAVANAIDKTYEVQKQVMLADLPSETEHNMSALYVGDQQVLAKQSDREKELLKRTGKDITFKKLVDTNATTQDPILVLTYKDIDSAGEKLQLDAIKLFAEFEKVLITKIEELLRAGYEEVHLVTDHGFVLTGLLSDADKLEVHIDGNHSKSERYIRSVEKQHTDILWSIPKAYDLYQYINVAQSDRPFRTPGLYGFAHGGFAPQEVIIPNFMFKRKGNAQPALQVFISNKNQLADVSGEYFKIKLETQASGDSLFDGQRTINITLYQNNIPMQSVEAITIQKDQQWDKEFGFEGHQQIVVLIEDATTKEKIDQVVVNKSSARDMGGLF